MANPGTSVQKDSDFACDDWGPDQRKFAIVWEWEDKNRFWEMLWMEAATVGMAQQCFQLRYLTTKTRSGMIVPWWELDAWKEDKTHYPLTAVYKPPRATHLMETEEFAGMETQRMILGYIRQCTQDVKPNEVRNWYQRKTFERYQLYIEDEGPVEADSPGLEEMYARYPHLAAGGLGLIARTGPNLTRVMKGDEDIVTLLFS